MPGRQAMYALVAQRIREEIRNGIWGLGDTLPGEIPLAERYGVARATIVRALEVLREQGFITTAKGSGSRVASVPVLSVVTLDRGDWAMARLPEDHEADSLGVPPGVPVMVVVRADNGDVELYDGAATRVCGRLVDRGQ